MSTLQIPISKGKDLFIPIDTEDLMDENAFPADVFREIMFQGLKQVLNRGMTGGDLQSSKNLQGRELESNQKALLDKAEENWEACKRGEIRVTGGKAKAKSTSNKALTTEAMRIARQYLKMVLKREGKKVSLISGKVITQGAKEILDGGDEAAGQIWAEAEANLKERAEKEQSIDLKINIEAIKEDPTLVAAAEQKKRESEAKKAQKVPAGVLKARPGISAQRTAH